jgi:RNA polymerase sigma-70 factor (ECF subfamily)
LLLFARQWSATMADAEDAVQDGFVRFWKSRRKAHDETAYLYACVRTAAMDIGRGQRRRQARELTVRRHEEPAFAAPLENVERQAAIEAALQQLPADQREVIVLKIWGGLTFAQIAQTVGAPLSTVASRFRYALTRLEQDLAAQAASE